MVIKAGPSFSGGVQGRGRDRVTNPEDLGSTIMPPAIGVGPHERLFMRQNTNLNLYRAELSKIIGATKLTLGLTKSRAVVRGHFEANSKINAVDISCNVDDQGPTLRQQRPHHTTLERASRENAVLASSILARCAILWGTFKALLETRERHP